MRRRTEQAHGTERWTADDLALDRSVTLLIASAEDDRTPAILDAARRAASVGHDSFVRILDVAVDAGVGYVVEEDLSSDRTLTQLVTDGGLPGDEVRRIGGEVASALDAAGARGAHHLMVTPDDITRSADGDIRIRGLETAAARAGIEGLDAEAASRRDAIGVVALTYAGLTGLWPLSPQDTTLQPAPRIVDGVAAPSEVAAGVPRDLDALCRLTLNDDQGPVGPGDFARQIAPWSTRQVIVRPTTDPIAALTAADPDPAPPVPVDSGVEPTIAIPIMVPPVATPRPEVTEAPAAAVEATAHTSGGVAGVLGSVGGAVSAVGDRLGGFARRTADRVGDLAPARPTGTDAEPPAPLLPAEPLTPDESRLALSLVAGFLALALVIGLWGVSRIGAGSDFGFGGSSTPQTRTTTVAPTTSASASASSGTTPLEGLQILGAEAFDPLGDQSENNSEVPKVFDGDAATEWDSEGYSSPALGGIKAGVGVVADLGPNKAARSITLVLPAAADVSVYLATERSLDGATKVGSKADAKGTVAFPVPEGTQGQYVIVWFTSLADRGDDGRYRARLAEITIAG